MLQRSRTMLLCCLIGSCLFTLSAGCRMRGAFHAPALPALALHPPPAPPNPTPVGTLAPLTFAKMKRAVKPGMTEAQLRAAFGKPYEDMGANRIDDQAKYGRTLEILAYQAPDGDIIVNVVNGRVTEWFGGPTQPPRSVPQPQPITYKPPIKSKKIYFVPIGDFPASQTQSMIDYCQKEMNLPAQALPATPLYASLQDSLSKQLIAEKLIGLMKRQNPALAEDPHAILIGLTQYDMSTRTQNLNFVFGTREADRFGIISTARLDPVNYGQDASASKLQKRLQKMVLRDIGMLYYERSGSSDTQSVLYGSIGGLPDLDALGEKL